VSGAADNTLRLWAVATGKCLYTWEFPTAVKRVAFNEAGTQVVCITEQRMGYQCAIRVFDINHVDGTKRQWPKASFFFFFVGSYPRSLSAESKDVIITGHESGKVALFNVKTGEEIENNERAHSDVVTDLQLSKDRTYCVTASKDKAARVCDWYIFLVDWLVVLMMVRYTTLKLSW
jgi:translation initiation factor 3 subunit I